MARSGTAKVKGRPTHICFMAGSPFSKIPMDHELVPVCLQEAGVGDLQKKEVSPKHLHYTGTFEGEKFHLNLYINAGGLCTVGKATGFDETVFEKLAKIVVERCKWAEAERLDQSLPKFAPKNVAALIDSLQSLGAVATAEPDGATYKLTRVKGPREDVLTVKAYFNGTLQLQGRHAQVAVWAQDFLRSVMPLDEFLAQQREVYKIPLTVAAIKDELTARIPNVHDALLDEVRIQLSSALALTKVGIELEDYAALTFPALRGLEGFCLQLLSRDAGFTPPKNAKLGEYFAEVPGRPGEYGMRSPQADSVAKPLQFLLARCYTLWNQQRHRLFHMDGTVETSRILDDRGAAVELVIEVLDLIDLEYATYLKSKP